MIRPLFDKVVVQLIEKEEQSVLGLIIPDASKEAFQRGEIKAVGPDVTLYADVGNVVIFLRETGTNIKIDGQDYLILSDKDLVGIV